MNEEQTTLGNMHEKRFNSHFTTNPLVIPVSNEGFGEEDIKLLKEITKDGFYAVKEREMKEMIKIEDREDCEYDCDEKECIATDCPR